MLKSEKFAHKANCSINLLNESPEMHNWEFLEYITESLSGDQSGWFFNARWPCYFRIYKQHLVDVDSFPDVISLGMWKIKEPQTLLVENKYCS